MTSAAAIADYRHKLKHHDWSFEFSDDGLAWNRGNEQRKELKRLQAKLDPKGVIWNSLAPSGYHLKDGK